LRASESRGSRAQHEDPEWLAADQTQREDTSKRLEDLIPDLEQTLDGAGGSLSEAASPVHLRAA
jgi:hypothetical protein